MKRNSPMLLLLTLAAVLGLVAAACGNDDSGGGASPTATATSAPDEPTPTPTSDPSNPCADVTDAMVSSALPDLSSITDWDCVADSDDRPWVGGSGVEGDSDVNFILETGGDVAFVQYDGSCENPPVPDSLLQYCEAS